MSMNFESHTLDRRSFLKGAGVLGAAGLLSACGGSCDGCNGCGNSGGGRVETIYQPYIDGEKELAEINAEYSASRGLVR